MQNKLLKIWQVSQPKLEKPRRLTAIFLRKLLWRTTFIAITGSNGKSTATRYLAAILSSHAPTQWTRLNRNTQSGITETIAFCTPWKTRFAVFEVGAGKQGGIEIAARLIRPDIAVVLSVFLEHRSFFKTLDRVAGEKAKLLQELPEEGIAVLNSDDAHVSAMPVPAGRKVLRFGASPDNDIYYENALSAWPEMLRFTAIVDGERQEIRTRLLGEHWIGTLLACIAVARQLGVSLEKIAQIIKDVPPYPGRMQLLRLPSGAIVIRDEFKGTEHTVSAAFEELRKADAHRKYIVFCDVTDSSKGPRVRLRKIGRRAAQIADHVIFIGENSHHGVRGAREGGLSEDRAIAFPDYSDAAQFLKPVLGPGDVVLLKGSWNNQLTRLFFSLLGEVRCTIPVCKRPMVCDDCQEFRNKELVKLANLELSIRVD